MSYLDDLVFDVIQTEENTEFLPNIVGFSSKLEENPAVYIISISRLGKNGTV